MKDHGEDEMKTTDLGLHMLGLGYLCSGVSGGELARAQGFVSTWAKRSTTKTNCKLMGEVGEPCE